MFVYHQLMSQILSHFLKLPALKSQIQLDPSSRWVDRILSYRAYMAR